MIEAVCADQSCVLLPGGEECHGDLTNDELELLFILP